MTPTLRVEIVATSPETRRVLFSSPHDLPLPAALRGHLLRQPLDPILAGLTLGEVDTQVTLLDELPPGTTLFTVGAAAPAPVAAGGAGAAAAATGAPAAAPAAGEPAGGEVPAERGSARWPVEITDPMAVERAYSTEIDLVASFLRRRLSVLVICDKLVVEYLGPLITERAGATGVKLEMPGADRDQKTRAVPRSHRQRQLDQLRDLLRDLKDDQFLIIPHLDLLSSGADGQLQAETRDLIELLYDHSGRLMLAFVDPSLGVPEVLAERFGVRIAIAGSPRVVRDPVTKEELALGEALVTRAEAELFEGFNAAEFHKHVAGLNPIRLRQALRYAFAEHQASEHPSDADLRRAIRGFKAQMSATFEVPDVTFEDIGGYQNVKDDIEDALQIMSGLRIPGAHQRLQSELMSRGFIFYGPPGTGKTLFAKAIANRLNATIMVVSGPEVTDKYVGEGERKIRELFAAARRNAPSVIVFDEFDAIAGRRTDRDDGGSRAGNAMVAQLLTELDGFREDVPFLVIGTTNQLRLIDPAMLRPSRFRAIRIDLPNVYERRAIIGVHAKRFFEIDLSQELIELIADATENRSGDDLQSIFRDAFVGYHLHNFPADDPQHFPVDDPAHIGELVGRLNRSAREQREDTL